MLLVCKRIYEESGNFDRTISVGSDITERIRAFDEINIFKMEKTSKKPPTAKLLAGVIILIVGFLSPLLIPLVLSSGFSAGVKSVISGLLAFGIPELFMLIAVEVMGKEGFNYFKRYSLLVLRRYGPPDEVSPKRHIIGLIMFIIPLVVGIIAPYFRHKIAFFENSEITIMIILHTMLFLSLFVLGGNFWDKLRSLFVYRSRAILLDNQQQKPQDHD